MTSMRDAASSSPATQFRLARFAHSGDGVWWTCGSCPKCSGVHPLWTGIVSGVTLTSLSTRRLLLVTERLAAGLIDTSVVIDLERIDATRLPRTVGVSAITMAELAAGPAATQDPAERARRQDRLQRAEAAFEPIPFDSDAARAYGRVYAAVVAAGRRPRRRFADLLIAATAVAEDIPLVTRNAGDLVGLDDLLDVVAV